MPGWSPPVRLVGPWRAVRIERRHAIDIVRGDVYAAAESRGGTVTAALTIRSIGATTVRGARLEVGERTTPLSLAVDDDGSLTFRGLLSIPDAEHWWPHTHGGQPRYDAKIVVDSSDGSIEIAFGAMAFRRVDVDTSADGFAIQINGVTVFCRGACWTTPDIVTLDGTETTYRALLILARDAGMNMLRVGGTMVYEADRFYDLCDELGILVWQEFMFANMDYPAADAQFMQTVRREAEGVIARLRRHPSIAVFCGNSEVEQQAAMLGLEPALWSNAIFRDVLPQQCAVGAPDIPYWPASPTGGALPFHTDSGVAHYFGVGAYLRPLEDARRSQVRFTSECLGFSHVPDSRAVDVLLPNGEAPFHHPRWKARVPRDHGAGWDFDDVRDHYFETLLGLDPMLTRYTEMDRYLALSRVVTGDVMGQTIGEWRRSDSSCRGALVWFFQDLWLGAGWGVIDASGRPKAAYYALKRAMQPIAMAITDEGANGLHAHVANDTSVAIDGEVGVVLLREGATVVASGSMPIRIPARGGARIVVDQVLRTFHDVSSAYRFGPRGHDVVVTTLRDAAGHTIAEAHHFPGGLPSGRTTEPIISGRMERVAADSVAITLRAERFAQSIAIECGDLVPDDNYFHLMPGAERTIVARGKSGGSLSGFAHPLNSYEGVHLTLKPASPGQTSGPGF